MHDIYMNKHKILIIDDDEYILSSLKKYFESNNYIVQVTKSGIEIFNSLNLFDIIILDIMMPNMDGIEFCNLIRDRCSCPIIFISAKTLEEDKVKAFSIGGDDYITKPFSLKELKARVESHLRREERIRNDNKSIFCTKNIVIDITSKEIFCSGKNLNFTKKEYKIVELLMLHKNVVFSKEKIFDVVWDEDSDSCFGVITEIIKNIRKKIKQKDPNNSYITTVYGLGYKWEIKNEKK